MHSKVWVEKLKLVSGIEVNMRQSEDSGEPERKLVFQSTGKRGREWLCSHGM